MPPLSRRTLIASTAAIGAGALLKPDIASAALGPALKDEDGYEFWLRYRLVREPALLERYRERASEIVIDRRHDALLGSARRELTRGLKGMIGRDVPHSWTPSRDGSIVITTATSPLVRPLRSEVDLDRLDPDGFAIRTTRLRGRSVTLIVGGTSHGALYGVFEFLRRIQLRESISALDMTQNPRNRLRMFNHWDNADRTIERGYAGMSIFHWDELPDLRDRYTDYARMLASLGINGTVINNVNDTLPFLQTEMIHGLAGLADLFREWGIKLYICANFAAPIGIGGLDTADPVDPDVQAWWRSKVDELYRAIPDFGGLMVKADSEGQPGPDNYGRTPAEGANMIADAVRPHDGLVIWRTWVWDIDDSGNPTREDDAAKDAHDVFAHLDGEYAENVILQHKKGPDDFPIRETFHPLFGALPRTNSILECQITQEYTGGSETVCYLVPEWKAILDADTYARGEGSTVAKVVDGSLHDQKWTGMVGVANIGDDRNWTGHHLAAANTYGFSRLAWDPTLGAEEIADEWVRMTFGHTPVVVETTRAMLLASPKIFEDYTSPLGVARMNVSGRPGENRRIYPDLEGRWWFHRTDAEGTGFDRTVATGSGFTAQYNEPVASQLESLEDCPEEILMYFHHVPYRHELTKVAPGKTVIQHIYDTHFEGCDAVGAQLRDPWMALSGKVDDQRHAEVLERIDRQQELATMWRDQVVWYYFDHSGIADERDRMGVRVATEGRPTLVAGQATALALNLTNATPRDMDADVRLASADGWTSTTVVVPVASGATESATIEVTPPAGMEPAEIDLTIHVKEVDGPLESESEVPVGVAVASPYPPIADTYIRSGSHADSNFGSDRRLDVKLDTSDGREDFNRKTFLRFDVADVDPAATVKLQLFAEMIGSRAADIEVYGDVDGTWDPGRLTWNNADHDGGNLVATSDVGELGDGSWVEFDITDHVRDHLDDGVLNLRLEAPIDDISSHVVFHSRRSTSGWPNLDVRTD